MEPGVVGRPSLREAPAYWLLGKRVPPEFRPWLAERVMRDDYRVVPESVKQGETRRVHVLCATSSMGWLIHAMVGSLGGCGRRVKRVGFAA